MHIIIYRYSISMKPVNLLVITDVAAQNLFLKVLAMTD